MAPRIPFRIPIPKTRIRPRNLRTPRKGAPTGSRPSQTPSRMASAKTKLSGIQDGRKAGGIFSKGNLITSGLLFGVPTVASVAIPGAIDILNYRSDLKDQIYDAGPRSDGSFKVGVAGTLLGLNNQQALTEGYGDYGRKVLAGDLARLSGANMRDRFKFDDNLTIAENQAVLDALLPEADAITQLRKDDINFGSKETQETIRQFNLTQASNEADRAALRSNERLQIQNALALGEQQIAQATQQMLLADAANQRDQQLNMYNAQVRADDLNYRNRMDLMQGLSALTMGLFS